ncbi:MAG: DUF262 domain-containing protein [Candidatus Nitronauta litoralis]|uniref:DUF262 domain-containing protein n=1 Tax=Candidatus Nitronauta litoralis TaxID=2705533 RepID=A0A7T0BWE9_9BACT|nr:MAG: DUF262 domain-containing protein [Candidatus Nitronauta litoralis]
MSKENLNPNLEEEIEGLGADEDASLGDYPIDTLLIRTETRTVHDVLRRIEKETFVMDPDFQRDFIWPDDKQSKLIESVLMRIPLPVFYLAEDDKGRNVVVDGLQRLSTFQYFVKDKLKLKLPNQRELNKKLFSELSPKLQNRVEDCNLVLYIIDSKVPEQARLDIFERVNGGVPLTRQQMRNCLFMGKATRLLKTEAKAKLFSEATGGSLRASTMRDREFVNRFCAFKIFPFGEYKGEMDEFLAQALRKMNSLSDEQLKEFSNQFRTSLVNNYKVFGRYAFRKHYDGSGGQRNVINASIWDVMTTGLSDYPEDIVEKRKEKLKAAFFKLMEDAEFIKSITYGTNSVKAVKCRFEMAGEMIGEVFGA